MTAPRPAPRCWLPCARWYSTRVTTRPCGGPPIGGAEDKPALCIEHLDAHPVAERQERRLGAPNRIVSTECSSAMQE
jgi:hypothetical protein